MEKYLGQLIQDIREARTRVIPPNVDVWEFADLENEAEEEDRAYVEQFMYGKQEPISIITGIETGYLPIST